MAALVRRDKAKTPDDSSRFEAIFGPAVKPAPKLYYRLLHDDIWPTTQEPAANVFPIAERQPVRGGIDTSFRAQMKEIFLDLFGLKDAVARSGD